MRYVKENIIREDFLTFVEVHDLTGEHLARTLVQLIAQFDLRIEKLRGQGYDGAASMSGRNEGVQAHILKLAPLALYTHCVSHCLNLVVCKSSTIPSIRNMLGVVSQIASFFSASPLRAHKLKNAILSNSPNSLSKGIIPFCDTRWVERHDSLLRIREHLIPIYQTLSIISEAGDSHAEVLKNAFSSSDFIISLTCALVTTQTFQNLSRSLQKVDTDLVVACDMVKDIIIVLKDKRASAETVFKTVFSEAAGTHFDIISAQNL